MTHPRIAQPALEAIGAWEDGMPLDALVAVLKRSREIVVNTVQKLKRRGLVEVPERGTYRITQAGREWLASGKVISAGQGRRRFTRTRGLRERAWWLMREMRKFTLADLLTTLATGTERDAEGNLRTYLAALQRAGIVVQMKRRVPGTAPTSHGHIIWWLKRDLGRMAPVFRQRHSTVFDPNSGEIITSDSEERCDE